MCESNGPAVTEPELTRLRLDLCYDGADFFGWAHQPGLRTVQAVLTEALAAVLRIDSPRLTVAGRTDAGVHAAGQVCHLDVATSKWRESESTLLRRLAGKLPPDLRVTAVTEAPEGFDARFSAIGRRYAYHVCDAPWGVPPLRRRSMLWNARPLDVAAMNAAAERLLGEHDFAAFCRRREGATTIRALQRFAWSRVGRHELVADVRADAFCHSMVRSLVGATLAVGEGRRPVEFPAQALASRTRHSGVLVVAPHGLSLEQVYYPPADQLGSQALAARRVRTLPGD